MKTPVDVVDEVYSLIVNSSINTQIDGIICKLQRPLDSLQEDVVINTLPVVGDEETQQCIININVFTKDISEGTPNIQRLRILGRMLIDILSKFWGDGYNIAIEQTSLMADEGKSHYLNIRLNYFTVN